MSEESEERMDFRASLPDNATEISASSSGGLSPAEEGPGEVAVALTHVTEHIRDLATDKALPRQEREFIQFFYSHERDRLQLRLAMLDQQEKVRMAEGAVESGRKALEFARSEGGRAEAKRKWQTRFAGGALDGGTKNAYQLSQIRSHPEEDELREAELHYAEAEGKLRTVRSELQTAATALERFTRKDVNLQEQKTAARRWESSRDWKAITPEELRPAVKAIRHTFEHNGCWQAAQSTMKLCYAALHPKPSQDPSSTTSDDLLPYKRFLTTLVGPHIQQSFLGPSHPAPVIFKSYADVLETAMKTVVRMHFVELLEVASAQADILNMHPIEWTKRHIDILISAEKFGARTWIREVCDYPDLVGANSSSDIFLGHWRCPRFVHMQPAGNTPYDAARLWEREGLGRSMELLESWSNRLPMHVRFELDKIVGAAYIQFAKRPIVPASRSRHAEVRKGKPPTSPNPPVATTQPPDVWQSFGEKFRALSEEELSVAPHNIGDRWLHGFVDYKDKSHECGLWYVSGGINEGFRGRFDVEATRAGIALNSKLTGEPRDVWLHRVFADLMQHESELLFAPSEEGGIIVRVCEASAIYCARLEKQALIAGSKNATESAAMNTVVDRQSTNDTLLETVIRKVQNPLKYRWLTIPEAALYFEVKVRTIHRWTAEGKLRSGGRRGAITIDSIRSWEKKRSKNNRSL